MNKDPRTAALGALSRFLVAEVPLSETLTRIAEITVEALPGAAFAGMTLLDDGGRGTTAVFTDPGSPEIDAAQYATGEGPCLDAWRTRRVVHLPDLAASVATDRYAAFCELAHSLGIHSTLSLPLHVGDRSLGALNLYATSVDGFGDADLGTAQELADVAAVLLANSQDYWAGQLLNQQLDAALSSRAVIDQAKGILMARTPQLDADAAFELLKRTSQRENLKLRDVAVRIVEGRALRPVADEPESVTD